jgi:hypothetical protein
MLMHRDLRSLLIFVYPDWYKKGRTHIIVRPAKFLRVQSVIIGKCFVSIKDTSSGGEIQLG